MQIECNAHIVLFADYQRFNKKHPPGVLFFNCLSFRQKNNVCVAPFPPPGFSQAKPSLRLGRVWVGDRYSGGLAGGLKRQNP